MFMPKLILSDSNVCDPRIPNPKLKIEFDPIGHMFEFSVFPTVASTTTAFQVALVVPEWFTPSAKFWFAWLSEQNIYMHHGGTWSQVFPGSGVLSADGKSKTFVGSIACAGVGNFHLASVRCKFVNIFSTE